MMDIVELLENLNVENHQQAIIDAAVDEIAHLRNDTENAMSILLTQTQIKYIKSRTFAGPSKKEIVKRLVNIGIECEQQEVERENNG